MNRFKLPHILLLTVMIASIFMDGCNETKKGYLVLERPPNNGALNIRASKVDVDSSKSDTVLIGGDQKLLQLTVGKHSIQVHSRNPYDPNSKDYSWQSEQQEIAISKEETTKVKIIPHTKGSTYCCSWLIKK